MDSSSIIESIPLIRGTIEKNVPLNQKSWMGVGGPAEILFIPEDSDDLVYFLRNIPENIPITVLGAMSNVLIRDGGIEGVVILLKSKEFQNIYRENDILEVGAGVNCTRFATYTVDSELGGLEFLVGLPGTIGGALKMNAGCYGSEISDFLVEFEAVTISGQVKWFTKKDIKFEYRKSNIPNDLIITRAWFKVCSNVDYDITKKVQSVITRRKASQPLNKRSCGSTFKNPYGKKAWELIEKAGGRGMRVGGAAVSDKHCNFIINDDNATADDVENLGEKIRQKVLENSNIKLEWEVIRLGRK